ncbi:PD-(D/E)XK nuclease domain-containing protein [Deltaproteobacteria bacterium TL4]
MSYSEKELNKGYADLFLEPFLAKYPEVPFGYLIELKYFKRNELTDNALEASIQETREQLPQYLKDQKLTSAPKIRGQQAFWCARFAKAHPTSHSRTTA